MARFEAVLQQDLAVLKHRQTIHPVLQEGKFFPARIEILEAQWLIQTKVGLS